MVNYIVKDLNNFLEYFEILVPEGKYLEGFVNTKIYIPNKNMLCNLVLIVLLWIDLGLMMIPHFLSVGHQNFVQLGQRDGGGKCGILMVFLSV